MVKDSRTTSGAPCGRSSSRTSLGRWLRRSTTGRLKIQLPDEGTAELTFRIRGIPSEGTPSAYLVLRETRDARDPDRVVEYWYGLVHRRVSGDVVYEAWHRHDHGPGTSNDAHHHLKVNDVPIDRKPGVALHSQPAILALLESLIERIGEDQGE